MIDTGPTMIAAYIVATVVYVGYTISLWARGRRLRARLDASKQGARGR